MPTIPPPPPFLEVVKVHADKTKSDDNNNIFWQFDSDECSWALSEPEIRRACFFARVCEFSSPRECFYTKVQAILQNGPTCGLCALSMIFNGYPTTEDLLLTAKQKQFTNNGEMFSAKWLLDLMKLSLEKSSLNSKNVRSYLYDGNLNTEFIKQKLKNHAMILVPYDADRNHYPCKVDGHKAHWALVCGYLINDDDEFYVFVRHGKTKNMGLFSLKDLSESNDNLNEFEQPAWHPNEIFLLPEDGIQGAIGLRNKSIVIEGLPNIIIKIV